MNKEILQTVSAEQAHHYRIFPIEKENDKVWFKTDGDNLANLAKELNIVLSFPVALKPCSSEELTKLLFSNYRIQESRGVSNISYSNDFLEKIVIDAKRIGSSDIHFEPYERNARIRFRLDGKLVSQYSIPPTDYPQMVNKIKIRAGLDIAEKRLPQDGRMTLNTHHEKFDLRVSSLPTLYGEKIVLRILTRDNGNVDIENLGFSEGELKTYLQSIKKPNGIILISGPTGSGKTTTLYATLKLLNQEYSNILTIEDPIEYTLEGINQVQLRENIGLDFPTSLKTFLRQDPDIIMVGEIRDVNTANMAIRAALTGHLVFSTIHTNSAWGTISRLIDMGVPPFLVASTLNASIAQRLVRKLCPKCKEKDAIGHAELPLGFTVPENLTHHYKARGCQSCHFTGYNGRKAIYEIIPINQELIHNIKHNQLQIDDYLSKNNIQTLQSNAIQTIKEGISSVEEVYPLLLN